MRRLATLLVVAAQIAAPAQSPDGAVRPPEEFFGFRMGEDRQLAAWPEIQKYFEGIAAASPRVELVDAGPSTDGNRLIAAIVSSPENIARLDEIRAANLRLADPRKISEGEAHAVAARNPVVVAMGASIHASEIGATQAVNELLYTLATATDPQLVNVLENVVLVLLPSLNPDGHILVVVARDIPVALQRPPHFGTSLATSALRGPLNRRKSQFLRGLRGGDCAGTSIAAPIGAARRGARRALDRHRHGALR